MKTTMITKILTTSALSILLFASCNGQKAKTASLENASITAPAKGLTKIAETDTLLATPESVLYEATKDVIYVSNVNGDPTAKDGNGFISIINLKGEIINREWIKGLDAPKGMGIYNNHLFVTDINQVIDIDIEKGEIVNRHMAKDAKFLNDIAIDAAGNIFISDMTTNQIYLLSNSKLEMWLFSDKFNYLNGLFVDGNSLLAGNSNTIYAININTKEMTEHIRESGGIDGLEALGNNKFIVSDWTGNISIVSPNEPKQLILSTVDKKINAADIDFIIDKKLVLVPTFFDNRVMIYSYAE